MLIITSFCDSIYHILKECDIMKLTILGSGGIGYPLAFCNCENCVKAREKRGKSIRKRASMLINDELLIDIGPDVQTAMIMYNKDMGKVRYLLQTHIHIDHFDEELLITRIPYMGPKNLENLEIFAHPTCLKIMSDRISQYEKADLITNQGQKTLNVHSNIINHGEIKKVDKYKIKAIESRHDVEHGSLLYVITSENKNVFYATDTTALTKNSLEELKEYKLDVVILDHTFGDLDYSYSHLNEKLFIEQLNKMRKLSIIDNNTKIYGTHISHEGNKYHEFAEKRASKYGYHIAYDGLEIEI